MHHIRTLSTTKGGKPHTIIGIFEQDYLVRELHPFEVKHLRKLKLLSNFDNIPQKLIQNFLKD